LKLVADLKKLETQVSTSSIGHTSSHYLVPKRRVREFIGREDILARIDSGFSTTSDQTPRIVVIRGLGGQGKTQVALEYCRRAKNDGVRAIFWVDAMSESNVQNGYKTISESIKDPGQIIEDEARVRFVMEKLEIWRGPWILVFDNHDDPSAFNLQDYIPEGDGRILVTSRHADTDYLTDREKVIQLDGLPVEDALELLFKQSRLKATESNLQHGKLIVKRLGYHALAITQAGSYVHLRKIEFHDFLDHYSRQRKDILQQTPQMSQYRRKLNNTADEDETVLTVFTTWELSFQLLVTQEIPGIQKAEILTLFAFFDSKDISEELFRIYCNRKRPRKDSAKFGQRLMGSFLDKKGSWNHQLFVEVLVNLTQMSLVQAWSYDEDRVCHFTLHPLVKDWIRLRAIATAFRDYAIITSDILSCLLYSCYHHNQFELSMSNRLATLSHLESYKENLESIISNADDFNSIYRHFENAEGWFSGFLEQNGYAKRAEEMSRRLSNWLETTLGLEDSKTLTALSNLALVLRKLGKYEEAEEMNRRALQSREKVLGPKHPDTLVSLSNLALVLRKLGKYEEAEEMNRRALQSREKVLGPEHPDTLVSLNNLALVLQGLGKYEEAEKINQRALQCREKVLGPEHPDTLCSVWGMAVDMEMNQKYDDAVPYYQRACSGYKKVLGEGHPDTVSCMRGYSEMIEYMKQLEAKPSNPTE
jgi:tetratricopeptide (TPR) repeat protein